MKHTKKILSLALALVMALSLCTVTALADSTVTDFANLQMAVNNATNGVAATITLGGDITDMALYLKIPASKVIILDLNGKKLDRGLKSATENGFVISIDNGAELTVKDSVGTGEITGGYSNSSGGGVYNNGKFTMTGGSITGNTATDSGGGMYISETGSFTLEGGKITDNMAQSGGGIFSRGNVTMSGGEISGNNANSGAGVYVYAVDAAKRGGPVTNHFTMNGGSIEKNTASDKGGGVYADNYDMDAVLLGGKITGNTAGTLGGGVAANMPVTVGGTIVVKNNTVNKAANNVYLRNVTKTSPIPTINISKEKALARGASIGVTLESGEKGEFAANVTSDVSSYFINDATNKHPSFENGKLVFTERNIFDDIFDLIRFKNTTDNIKAFSILTIIFRVIESVFKSIFA